MVSAWMENGDIVSFMRATPDQNPFTLVGIPHFVSDIADSIGDGQLKDVTNGLQYLHRHDFVHGDLKGVSGHIH